MTLYGSNLIFTHDRNEDTKFSVNFKSDEGMQVYRKWLIYLIFRLSEVINGPMKNHKKKKCIVKGIIKNVRICLREVPHAEHKCHQLFIIILPQCTR